MPEAVSPKPPKSNRLIWSAVVCVAVGSTAVVLYTTLGFGLWGARSVTPLTIYGNVDIRQVSLGFRVAGRLLMMPFDEGDHASSGALLATLDPAPFQARMDSAAAKLASLQAAFAKALNGNRPQDIAAAEADLANRQAVLVSAEAQYHRRVSLARTGDASREDLGTTEAAFHSAQASVAQAQQTLSLQSAGTRVEDIHAAHADMQMAAADLSAAQTDFADTRLYAPSDGTINTRASEPGAIVAAGMTVFTLTIDRPMRVRAYVTDPDFGRVSPGQPVQVRTDGNTAVYHGTIGFISPVAEFTPKTVETADLRVDLVYRMRIIVIDPDDKLRQGQPVTVLVVAPEQPPAEAHK